MYTEIPGWAWAVSAVLLMFFVAVGASALIVHLLRERALRREREGMTLRGKKPRVGDETITIGRARHFIEVGENGAEALGWSSVADRPTTASETLPAEGPGASPKPPKTILIADDDPVVAFALKKRLQRMGYDVLRSPDSAHALLGAMKTRPDLVVLDVNMPGGNGLAVCEMMATDPQNAAIPVIVHTSRNDEETKKRCRLLGARYVEKSARSWEEIQSIVGELLGGPASQSEAPPPATAAIDPRLLSPVCGHPRVMCIDGRLTALVQRLAALGVEVLETGDLEEGFWTCFTEKPHVVVIGTDAPLPELQAALYRFTQHPVTRNLPVLLINSQNLRKEDLTAGLLETKSLKILEASADLSRVWSELEKIIPIGEPDVPLPRSVAAVAAVSPGLDGAAGEESVEGRTPNGADRSKRLTILCIDDDPVIAKSIALRVRPYGIEVKEAANGTQGFFLGLRERPDLVLLDLQMPEGDGQYVLSKFKNHPLTKDIPVVILTVESNAGVRRKMISSEAAGFLTKPVRWKEFFEEIGRFVPLPKKLIDEYALSEDELLALS